MIRLPCACRGRTSVRFPANSSHMCCVDLAVKGLASAFYPFGFTLLSLSWVLLRLSRRVWFLVDTGSCLFVVSLVASYLVVWPVGSSLASGFGLLSVFSPKWIRAPVTFGSTSVRASLPADVLWGSFVAHSFLPHWRLLNTTEIYVHQSQAVYGFL